MKRRSPHFLDCSPAAPRYFPPRYFPYQETTWLVFNIQSDERSPQSRGTEVPSSKDGKSSDGNRVVEGGGVDKRIFSSLFFFLTFSSTLEASAWFSSILLVSLSLVSVPSARGWRQALQAPPISCHIQTRSWGEEGGRHGVPLRSRFHSTQARLERRPSVVHWVACSASQSLFGFLLVFFFFNLHLPTME